jgi:Zinc finger C-x8-C-x5-C-x3-H type (and similar)/RNA-binding, Nab2-type zinc finger
MESCQFYNSGSGKCYRGDDCPFRHIRLGSKSSRQLCVFFQQGNCTRGDYCPFQHSAATNDKWTDIPPPVPDRVSERRCDTGSRYAAKIPADPPVSRPPLQSLHSERGWDTGGRSAIDNDTNMLAHPPSLHDDLPSEGERYGGGDVGTYETPHHDGLAPTDNNAANPLAGNQWRSKFNSAKPCRFFRQSKCRKGTACPFAHDSIDRFNEPQPERSQDVEDTETNHVADEEPALSSDVPAEADNDKQKVCEFFVQGLCMDGTTCPFKHDTLASWFDDGYVEVSNDSNNINEPAVCMNDTEWVRYLLVFWEPIGLISLDPPNFRVPG